ncbi:IclR family transcriptional regulator [Streptomyces acidicola]|uniref:IclR family transcriptional regulator n=1 Tax=Streptomyces acidicola TaxID=2596892 RepID=UPI0037F7AF0E
MPIDRLGYRRSTPPCSGPADPTPRPSGYRERGPQAVSVNAELGARRPLHATSVGKAYLSGLDSRERADLIRPLQLTPFTPQTLITTDDLERDIAKAQARGWTEEHGEFAIASACCGAPIFDHTGRVAGRDQRRRPQRPCRARPGPSWPLGRCHSGCHFASTWPQPGTDIPHLMRGRCACIRPGSGSLVTGRCLSRRVGRQANPRLQADGSRFGFVHQEFLAPYGSRAAPSWSFFSTGGRTAFRQEGAASSGASSVHGGGWAAGRKEKGLLAPKSVEPGLICGRAQQRAE